VPLASMTVAEEGKQSLIVGGGLLGGVFVGGLLGGVFGGTTVTAPRRAHAMRPPL